MRRLVALGCTLLASGLACSRTAAVGRPRSSRPTASARASLIQYDSLVAVREPGPHSGGGETTAYSFFAREEGLALVFRKRALHRGAAIGYHRNDTDEIYYVLSGHGELTLNGARHAVGPGTAILTRAGSFHGLRQLGADDLVILISYLRGADS
jgi:quercetin dioxygenase-like cupin family protein